MADVDDFLEHYGVPGMRWGFRRTRDGSYKRSGNRVKEFSDDAAQVRDIQGKRSTKGTSSLSNKELQTVITRLDLEKKIETLSPSTKGQGKKEALKLVNQFKDKSANALTTAAAAAVSAAIVTAVASRKGGKG